MARQGFSGAPLALHTLTRPRAAGARWRAGTARNALRRRTGAIRCPAWPTRTRGDIAHCAQLLCLSQVQHIMPTITKSAGAGHRLTSTRTVGRPPSTSTSRWMLPRAARPRPALNPQPALSRQPKWVLFTACRFAHRLEQHIRVHLEESGLSLHACRHHLPVPDRR